MGLNISACQHKTEVVLYSVGMRGHSLSAGPMSSSLTQSMYGRIAMHTYIFVFFLIGVWLLFTTMETRLCLGKAAKIKTPPDGLMYFDSTFNIFLISVPRLGNDGNVYF